MGRGVRVGWNVGTVWMRRLAHRSGSIPRRPPLRRPRIKLSARSAGVRPLLAVSCQRCGSQWCGSQLRAVVWLLAAMWLGSWRCGSRLDGADLDCADLDGAALGCVAVDGAAVDDATGDGAAVDAAPGVEG